MKSWARYTICGVIGLALGGMVAVRHVRNGVLGAIRAEGSWTSGTDFGSSRASAYTRAVVALRGILALPSHEARYYNAAVDSAGDPLDGRCRYRVSGGEFPAKWWSLTLYDHPGYLVANQANRFSVTSAAVPDPRKWEIVVAPTEQAGQWLPTGRIERFELTFRTYVPDDSWRGSQIRGGLPVITKEAC